MLFRKFIHQLSIIKSQIILIKGYLITYPYLLLLGVKLKNPPKIFGKLYIKLKGTSKLVIGSDCEFRSNPASNMIGINRRCYISTLSNEAQINIGNSCGFSGTVIAAENNITIGNNVRCGANTTITDTDWHTDDSRSGKPSPIIIGNNVWLRLNSVVLKGVRIGDNTLIGANSLVIKDIPANVIAGGNPCKVIKEITL